MNQDASFNPGVCAKGFFLSISVAVTTLLALGVSPTPAPAIVAVERDFPELVARAEQIVAGTVSDIREDAQAPGGPFTYVTLDQLSVMKGAVGSTLTLRFFGGTAGNTTARISDMPTFTLGERALLFVAGNGSSICPLVGVWQGRFRIRHDAALGVEIVEDGAGQVISGRDGRQLRRTSSKRSSQPALTLDQFRQLVADELATPTP